MHRRFLSRNFARLGRTSRYTPMQPPRRLLECGLSRPRRCRSAGRRGLPPIPLWPNLQPIPPSHACQPTRRDRRSRPDRRIDRPGPAAARPGRGSGRRRPPAGEPGEGRSARGTIDRTTTNLVDGSGRGGLGRRRHAGGAIVDTVRAVAAAAPRATITDAGSTKAEICRELREPPSPRSESRRPVARPRRGSSAAIPLAGDHRTGPEHARADLSTAAPSSSRPKTTRRRGWSSGCKEFWESLGAEVALLSPEEHDRALAATSHLPHLVAAALAAATPEEWLRLAGTGWGDTTRIAAGDPQLWTQIFSQNRAAVLDALRRFEHRLAAFDEAIAEGDAAALTTRTSGSETDSRCFGRLTSIPATDCPTATPRASPPTSPRWGWPRTCTSPRRAAFSCKAPTSTQDRVERLARELFADPVVEEFVVAPVGDPRLTAAAGAGFASTAPSPQLAAGAAQARRHGPGRPERRSRGPRPRLRRRRGPHAPQVLARRRRRRRSPTRSAPKVLANDAIEQVVVGPLPFDRLASGRRYRFELRTVAAPRARRRRPDAAQPEGQLYLQLAEMQTIQGHFAELGRDPTDVELETIAQTWSEHCSHKTLAGRIDYGRARRAAVREPAQGDDLRRDAGAAHAAGATTTGASASSRTTPASSRSTTTYDVCFKVETHNHPSAIEPYGGANTGLGGVIRDSLGTGLGAKPICNTDVFCFAPPDTPPDELPPGVLHPEAGHARRRRRRARLRQPHGHPHRQRRRLLRRALPRQPAGLLRHRRPDPARQVVQGSRSPAT